MVQTQLPDVHMLFLQHVHSILTSLLPFLLLHSLHLASLLLHLTDRHLWFFFLWPAAAWGGALLAILHLEESRIDGLLLLEVFYGRQAVDGCDSVRLHFRDDGFDHERIVVHPSEIGDDGCKIEVLLLHLLMMAATLFRLPRPYKNFHSLKDLIHPPHVTIHEMRVVNLQEPMILFILFGGPMTSIHVFTLLRSPPASSRWLDERRELPHHLILSWWGVMECELEMCVGGLRGGRRRERVRRVVGVFLLLMLLLWVKIEGVHVLGVLAGVIRFIIFIEEVLLLPFKDYSMCYKTPHISGLEILGAVEPKNIYFCVG